MENNSDTLYYFFILRGESGGKIKQHVAVCPTFESMNEYVETFVKENNYINFTLVYMERYLPAVVILLGAQYFINYIKKSTSAYTNKVSF